MLGDVGQRFLDDSVDRRLGVDRELRGAPVVVGQVQCVGDFEVVDRSVALEKRLQRRSETEVI